MKPSIFFNHQGLTSLCDQNSAVQSVSRHTDTQTDPQTDPQLDRKVNTEGLKIIYIDIRYPQV